MIQAFILDDTSGSCNPVKQGWLVAMFLAANEIRGLFVAIEGARQIGWL